MPNGLARLGLFGFVFVIGFGWRPYWGSPLPRFASAGGSRPARRVGRPSAAAAFEFRPPGSRLTLLALFGFVFRVRSYPFSRAIKLIIYNLYLLGSFQ